jgi:hypothetical protein
VKLTLELRKRPWKSRMRCVGFLALLAFTTSLLAQTHPAETAKPAVGDKKAAAPPDLTGIYGLTSGKDVLPAGMKNAGSPEEVSLLPAAIDAAKKVNLSHDPAKNCQALGWFRMMALDGNKIDVLPSPGKITILFENLALGNKQTIFLTRSHPDKLGPSWLGDSVGHWEGDTLVVDSTGFNDRTWLNSKGAQHTEALRVVQRFRLADGGKILEVNVSAEDPKTLTKPYRYTRYYKKLDSEIQEDYCEEESPVE